MASAPSAAARAGARLYVEPDPMCLGGCMLTDAVVCVPVAVVRMFLQNMLFKDEPRSQVRGERRWDDL
jgi:hypothetical protein